MNGKITFVAEIKERVAAELENVKRTVSSTKSTFQSAMGSIRGYIAGAFTVTAATAFARSMINYVSQVKDGADAAGMSTTRFQALTMAARNNGVEIGRVVSGMSRLQDVQSSIGEDKSLQESFDKLGISIRDVQSLSPDDLLQRIASSVRSTGNSAIVFDVFGRGASRLLSTLNELADGWDSLVAKTSAGIISEDSIERIERMGDTLENAKTVSMAFGAQIGTTLADVASWFGKISTGLSAGGAFKELADDQNEMAAARSKREKAMADAKAVAVKAQQERKDAAALGVAKGKASDLGTQFQKASLSDKQYEAVLQAKVNTLVEQANADGLSALDRQLKQNAALEASIELLELQKQLKADADRETADAKKRREEGQLADKESAEVMRKSAYDKLKPQDQLKATESNMRRLKAQLGAGPMTPEARRDAIKQLDQEDRERTRLKKSIADDASASAKNRSEKLQAAQDAISDARRPRIESASLREYQQRASAIAHGKAPRDSAAEQTAANTRIIAENTKRIAELTGSPQ